MCTTSSRPNSLCHTVQTKHVIGALGTKFGFKKKIALGMALENGGGSKGGPIPVDKALWTNALWVKSCLGDSKL